MIYESAALTEPIKQGDIFLNIPRVDLSLTTMAIVDGEGQRELQWKEAVADNPDSTLVAVLPIRPVTAIVITQDCDTVRGEYICLAEVEDFLKASGKTASPPSTPKSWQSLLRQHSRSSIRLFYLPEAVDYGITKRMAADFRVVLRVPREGLEAIKEDRLCRLNDIAREHFRETLGQFFRRYAYDEWYPLTQEEYRAYANEQKTEIPAPYPWQKDPAPPKPD